MEGKAHHPLLKIKTDRFPDTAVMIKAESRQSQRNIYYRAGPSSPATVRVLCVGLVVPPASCPGAAAALVTGLGDVPDLLEDLDAEALMIGIVAGEVAVVLALGV